MGFFYINYMVGHSIFTSMQDEDVAEYVYQAAISVESRENLSSAGRQVAQKRIDKMIPKEERGVLRFTSHNRAVIEDVEQVAIIAAEPIISWYLQYNGKKDLRCIGRFFKLIPFTNQYYNVLSVDVFEDYEELIPSLKVSDAAKVLGCSYKSCKSTLDELSQTKLITNGIYDPVSDVMEAQEFRPIYFAFLGMKRESCIILSPEIVRFFKAEK